MGAESLAQNYPKCPRIYLPNMSAQAQTFKISIKKDFIGRPLSVLLLHPTSHTLNQTREAPQKPGLLSISMQFYRFWSFKKQKTDIFYIPNSLITSCLHQDLVFQFGNMRNKQNCFLSQKIEGYYDIKYVVLSCNKSNSFLI